jgi:hypothetical protein
MLQRWGLSPQRVWRFVAGRDCFAARPTAQGTIAEQWAEAGWDLKVADDDRINGAAEVLRRLGDTEPGQFSGGPEEGPAPAGSAVPPTLFVLSRCARLIECLPALEHDPHRPEDVLKVDCDDEGAGGDDAYDALRYGLMAAPGDPRRPVQDIAALLNSWRG